MFRQCDFFETTKPIPMTISFDVVGRQDTGRFNSRWLFGFLMRNFEARF